MDNNSLIRLNLESSLDSSLKSLAREAEVVMLLIDCSGSMEYMLSNGKRRIDALRDIVASIKGAGHVPMIAFGGPFDAQVRFVDNVPEPDGGTPLHIAIPYAKEYGATRLVVVSDGMPDLPEQCDIEAKKFGGKIDVVFVGDPGEVGGYFLENLAAMTGGSSQVGDLTNPKELSSGIIGLLAGEVDPEAAPIQGPGFTVEEAVEPDEDDDDDEEEDDEEDDDDDE